MRTIGVSLPAVVALVIVALAPTQPLVNIGRAAQTDGDTIAYYRFETGPAGAVATSITDSSGNNLDGTILFGGPIYSPNVPVMQIPQTGQVDSFSMSFGFGDAASFDYEFPFQTLTNATLELWLNPNVNTEGDFLWTTNTVDSGDANRFNIYVNPNVVTDGPPYSACIDYREINETRHVLGCSNVSLPRNEWSYVAYVKQGDAYSIYVNSSVTGSVTTLTSQVVDSAPNLPTSTGWTINGRPVMQPSSCCQYAGLLDEIRLSSTALTPSQFLVSAATPATPIPPSQVATTASGLAYSRVSKTFDGTVTITNISTSTLSGPFQIVFTSLTSGVLLANATGTFNGSSYLTVPGASSLAPGATASVAVQFTNSTNATINFTPVVYQGSF